MTYTLAPTDEGLERPSFVVGDAELDMLGRAGDLAAAHYTLRDKKTRLAQAGGGALRATTANNERSVVLARRALDRAAERFVAAHERYVNAGRPGTHVQ